MGVMKRSLLLIALFGIVCTQANAGVTVEQTTDPEFISNSGYSEATAEEVLISKQRANAQPAEPLYEKKRSKFVRFWRNVYSYIDPAWDNDERIHHNINQSPNWRDL